MNPNQIPTTLNIDMAPGPPLFPGSPPCPTNPPTVQEVCCFQQPPFEARYNFADSALSPPPNPALSNFADNDDSEIEEDAEDEFPFDCLPKPLRRIVEEVSRTEQVHPILPAVCGLGIISAALGAGAEIQTEADATTRGNVFIMLVAASGVGKSKCLRRIAEPLYSYEKNEIQEWRSKDRPILEGKRSVIEVEIKKLNSLIGSKKGNTCRDQNISEMGRLKAELLEVEDKLIFPCMLTSDATKEALAHQLSHGKNEAIASISGEARGCVDVLCGRYNKMTGEDIYTQGYSGDPSTIHRKGSATISLRRPCLTVLWLIQPDKARGLLTTESMTSSGLMARFLIVNCNAEPQLELEDRSAINDTIHQQWHNHISHLTRCFHASSTPVVVKTTPEVRKMFREYHNEIVHRRQPGGDLADVTEYAARWRENAWRLALILHAAKESHESDPYSLSTCTARNAIKLMRWFSNQQLQNLSTNRETKKAEFLDRVQTILSTKPDFTCTLRDMKDRHGILKQEIEALVAEHPDLLFIRQRKPDGAGRPSVVVSLTASLER